MSGGVAKGSVEREMTEAWQALAAAVDSFSDTEMEQPGVVGGWSAKELLGHIAFWNHQAAHNLQAIAEGRADDVRRPGNPSEIDEWNERERRTREGKPLPAVREEWLDSFQEAMQALAGFQAGRLEEEFQGRTVLALFAEDTYKHYRQHLGDLNAWRQAVETSEA